MKKIQQFFYTTLTLTLTFELLFNPEVSFAQAGLLDNTFNGSGIVTTDIGNSGDRSYAVAIQPDGKIIAAGTSMSEPMKSGFSLVRFNSDGTLDTSFGTNGITGTLIGTNAGGVDDIIQSIFLQPDGKILATGRSMNAGCPVLRYNSDGSLDPSFGNEGIVMVQGPSWAYDIDLQSDGKILVACESSDPVSFVTVITIFRLNTDGSLDNSFGINGIQQTSVGNDYYSDLARSLAVQTDGKIIVAGYSFNGVNNVFVVVRYNDDGSLDLTFDLDGIVTTSLGPGSHQAYSVVVQNDGKIIVGGYATTVSYLEFALVRYNSDGSLDFAFSDDGIVTTSIGPYDDLLTSIALQTDGKIVASGSAIDYTSPFAVVRYNTDGSLDATFSSDGKLTIVFEETDVYGNAMDIGPEGNIVVCGTSTPDPYTFNYALAQCNSTGIVDPDFSDDGILELNLQLGGDRIYAMDIRADGKIIAVGTSNTGNGLAMTLSRYNIDGSQDGTFGNNGILVTNSMDYPTSIAIQDDGKILVGTDYAFGMYRFNPDGSLDNTFGTGGLVVIYDFFLGASVGGVKSIAIQPDGKIVAGGYAGPWPTFDKDFALARFHPDGSLDNSFSEDGKLLTNISYNQYDEIHDLALQPDEKIVAAGLASYMFGLTRYNSDGSLDNSFGSDGIVTTIIGIAWWDCANSVIVQDDGKIIAAGVTQENFNRYFALVRYESNGNLDNSFDGDGKVITDFGTGMNEAYSVAIQSDNKIIAAGCSGYNDYTNLPLFDFSLVRYNIDGTPDESFGNNGKVITDFYSRNDEVRSMALQNDGKIVLAGFADNGFDNDFALTRYLSELNVGVLDFSASKNSAMIYPNPVEHNTTLEYTLTSDEMVSISLIDITGKKLKDYVMNQKQEPGNYRLNIDLPEGLSSGSYFIVISTPSVKTSVKILK